MRSAIQRSVDFDGAFRPRRLWTGNLWFDLRFWTWTTAFAVVMTLGCGTPHATLEIAAPPTATAGIPFTITVTAIYEGKRDTVVNDVIHFTSSDSAATLPADYTFLPADAGSHTWPNGVTLRTPGSQTIAASLYMATGINGTATVTVSK